jgi:hypothetical protein
MDAGNAAERRLLPMHVCKKTFLRAATQWRVPLKPNRQSAHVMSGADFCISQAFCVQVILEKLRLEALCSYPKTALMALCTVHSLEAFDTHSGLHFYMAPFMLHCCGKTLLTTVRRKISAHLPKTGCCSGVAPTVVLKLAGAALRPRPSPAHGKAPTKR